MNEKEEFEKQLKEYLAFDLEQGEDTISLGISGELPKLKMWPHPVIEYSQELNGPKVTVTFTLQ